MDAYDEELDELEFAPVHLDKGFDSVIVVDNIPIVTEEKYTKLVSVVNKIFQQVGNIVETDIPKDEEKKTMGFCFIEFASPDLAKAAVERIDNYKLDKAHVFAVNLYSELQRIRSVLDEYAPPPVKEYKEPENLREWMMDTRALPQFVVRHSDETEIYWNEVSRGKLEPLLKRKLMTESVVQWSPFGSYLATFHQQGIILHGGPSWTRLMRFTHPGVKLIEFSPREKYLITYSPQCQVNDNPNDPQCIVVWDVRTGKKLRGFEGPTSPSGDGAGNIPWLQWSHDDHYLARIGEDSILVYQTPEMTLLDKKAIRIPGVKDFCWSPASNLISCWVPEIGDQAARVLLLEIPSRKEKRQQNFFNVTDVKLFWQNNGDFLCVQVESQKKTKTSTFLDIFRIREKQIPDEVVKFKEKIFSFAWEPKGTRFAVIQGENPQRPDVSFYNVTKGVEHLKTLDKKSCNKLVWSPQGQFIILAGLKHWNGVLEFFNTKEMETMATQEHFMATDIEWDPSGRFVASYVCHWRNPIENSYNIWSFQGRLVSNTPRDKFFQFIWRPSPPSLLSKEKIKTIQENLDTYSKKYKSEDKDKAMEELEALKKKRKIMKEEFYALLEERKKELAALGEKVPSVMRNERVQPEDFIEKEVTVEEVLKIVEEAME